MYIVDFEKAADKLTHQANGHRIISPGVHGVIDYLHAALFLGFGLLWRKTNKPASAAALSVGATVLTQALLTDYPLGAIRALSFEHHGVIDRAFGASSWAIPRIFGFADTPEARLFQSNSVVESTIVQLTDWNNERATRY